MTARYLLELGWSLFCAAAGAPCGAEARKAFEERYAQTATDGLDTFEKDPGQLGEVLAWLAATAKLAGMKACRHGREVSGEDVKLAASAMKEISGTTWCG